MHFVNPLVYMPMATEPSLVIHSFLNPVEPAFCTVIYGALIDERKEHLSRLILSLCRTFRCAPCTRQDNT